MESCFPRPNEFIPERWTAERPELITDKRPFVPFSNGRYSCVGRQLGLTELRLVMSALMGKYEIAFWEGDDGSGVVRNMKDNFTSAPGELKLVFVERKRI